MEGENPIHVDSSSKDDVETALRESQRWMRPLPESRLIALLGELYLKVPSQFREDIDREAMFRLYARELSAYPGDVVRDAIRGYRGEFFPGLPKLQIAIEADDRIAARRRVVDALESFLRKDVVEDVPPHRRPTQAQIERNERHFRSQPPKVYSQETLDRLAEVDRVHGDKAKAPGGKWKSVEELARQSRRAIELAK